MGRPREFDKDVAKDRALDLFWRDGYDRTGVAELERATGVGRKGLYNTFGSKRGLFRESLDLYVKRAVGPILAPLEAENAGRAEVESILRLLASPKGHLKENRGCLVCLTAESEVMRSEEVARCVRGYFRRLRNGFAHALRGAYAEGDLGPRQDPEVLGDFLVGTVMGLSAMARAGRPRARKAIFASQSARALGLPSFHILR